jgi:hypothetical protein
VTLVPRHVYLPPRILKPAPTKWPARHENGWRALGLFAGKPSPVVDVDYGWIPEHWDTPQYRQDVPKRRD